MHTFSIFNTSFTFNDETEGIFSHELMLLNCQKQICYDSFLRYLYNHVLQEEKKKEDDLRYAKY